MSKEFLSLICFYTLLFLVYTTEGFFFGSDDETSKDSPKRNYKFDDTTSVIKVQDKDTAYFECSITGTISPKTQVSWVRLSDNEVITVNNYPVYSDRRIVVDDTLPNKWIFSIKYVDITDAGNYSCQVGGVMPSFKVFSLQVYEPETIIVEGNVKRINENGTLILNCKVENALRPPQSFIWSRNDQYITDKMNERTFIDIMNKESRSSLTITSLQISEAGTYRCKPDSYDRSSIRVEVSSKGTELSHFIFITPFFNILLIIFYHNH